MSPVWGASGLPAAGRVTPGGSCLETGGTGAQLWGSVGPGYQGPATRRHTEGASNPVGMDASLQQSGGSAVSSLLPHLCSLPHGAVSHLPMLGEQEGAKPRPGV